MRTYLVDHHNRKEVEQGREEKSIHVMLHIVADGFGEGVQQNLADDESCNAKADVPHGPTLLQSAENQHDLHDNVDEQEDGGEDVDNNEETDGVVRAQTGPSLESQQRDHEADDEHGQAANTQKPDRERRAIFIELKADKTVDHQANAGRACKAALHGDEISICFGSRWHHTTVDDKRADCKQRVEVEESRDFLAACSDPVSKLHI